MPTLSVRERAVEVMYHLVTHDSHGYSLTNRYGNGEYETFELTDGTEVTLQRGDRDCSSSVIEAYEKACPDCTGGASTTSNMKSKFLATGLWEWHPIGDGYSPVAGDIYLNNAYHAAMYYHNHQLLEFSIDESPDDEGEMAGDQLNSQGANAESRISPFHDYYYGGWDGILAFIGTAYPSARVTAMQEILNTRLASYNQTGVTVTGFYDAQTQKGLVRLIQSGLKLYHPSLSSNITVDGWFGDVTFQYVNLAPVARIEFTGGNFMYHGEISWAAKAMLVGAFGADLILSDDIFHTADAAVLNAFKTDKNLLPNGICDARTFALLAPAANVSTLTAQYSHATGDYVTPVYPDPEDPNPDEGEEPDPGDDPVVEPENAITAMQMQLNEWLDEYDLGSVEENGVYVGNALTQAALVRLLQKSRNEDLSAGLTVNGAIGAATAASMDDYPVGAAEVSNWVVKAMLVGNGHSGIDLSSACYDEAARQALVAFQTAKGLSADGLCDGVVLTALAPAATDSTAPEVPDAPDAPVTPEEPDLPEQVENIEVDGWWDEDTTSALQRHYGTIVDGEIWGQWQPNVTANSALRGGWICDTYGSGSALIRALQADLGTAVDGVFGGADITAFQAKCGQSQTGVLTGPDPSIMVMQQRLNYGQW